MPKGIHLGWSNFYCSISSQYQRINSRAMRKLAIAVIVVGFVCLSAGAFMFLAGDLNSDDEMTAVSPLVRIPLDQLANSGSAAVIVTVPNNAQWERIRRQWGDPGYFVGAMSYRATAGQIHCLDELGITVEVKANTGAVPL